MPDVLSPTVSPPRSTPPGLPPGPRSRSPFASLLRLRTGGMLKFLTEAAAEFGDVAYFKVAGKPFCLLLDPELIRRVLVTDAKRFTKSHVLASAKTVLGDGLLTSDGALHQAQRRMIAPVFHAQTVKAYGDIFSTQAARVGDGWRDGGTLDIGEEMTELTLRVFTKSLFDTDLETEIRPIGQDMATIVRMFDRARNPLSSLLGWLPLPSNFRFKAALRRLDARLAGMIQSRKAAGAADANGRADLLSLLLMARDAHGGANGGQGGMSERQVRDEAVTLFMAGHETTANALIWTWLLLADHPAAEAALHAELDAVLEHGRLPTANDAARLPYTRAVIAESMRLRPPAWVIARQSPEAYDLGAYRLPPRTTILMPQYLVHRDGRWWPEPEAFRPERWLDDAGDRPKYAYFPFGGGPRSCVGEPFAWLEAILLLATIARRWRLERTDTAPVELHPTITLRPKDAVRMRTVPRTRRQN